MTRFLTALSDQRDKPITLLRADVSTLPCGLLLRTDTVDYVVVARRTSTVHARHVVLHELGHLLLDHPGVSQQELLSPQHEYTPEQERHAEDFAEAASHHIEHNLLPTQHQSKQQAQLVSAFGAGAA